MNQNQTKPKNKFYDRKREIAIIKRSLKTFIEKYGYEMTNYVANKILNVYRKKRTLEKEIQDTEQKLEELKKQKI